MSSFGIIALTPVSFPGEPEAIVTRPEEAGTAKANPHYGIAFAAKVAGEAGLINLELHELSDERVAQDVTAAVIQLSRKQGGRYGIKYSARQSAEALGILMQAARGKDAAGNAAGNASMAGSALVIISCDISGSFESLVEAVNDARSLGATVMVEVTTLKEAAAARELGIDGLVAKGSEAGGVTSETTAFILLQEITKMTTLPVWVQGGVGLYSAAACLAAGARGVVLDSQLLLARESAMPTELKQRIAAMDGTEITSIVAAGGKKVRVFARQGHPISEENTALKSLSDLGVYLPAPGRKFETETRREDMLLAVGQDIALAKQLAEKFVSVSGIIEGIKESAQRLTSLAREQDAFKADGALAESHKTHYPIVQGAMTRVSDTAEFALKVAEGGGLPFLALALMRGDEAETLVARTKELLGDKQWGVGVLGFVPQELRQEQFAVINRHKPPFALIAGGRPDQAKTLEDTGIATYLHVPSPILLSSFIEMGARRFIFEGRECGGHVGPRSSFVLWEQMLDMLANVSLPKAEIAKLHILMAGGIHDGLSAAMVAAMTAPLTERGMKVGVLIGTAYLFTKEAVETGAIVEKFQEAAIECQETVLLETGPGHAIRCINSPYKRAFDDKRVELVLANKTKEEVREELELMNLGRLRIASKGVTRSSEKSAGRESVLSELSNAKSAENPGAAKKLVEISKDEQWQDGMYMIGQVASMHQRVITIEELHKSVSHGSREVLAMTAGQEIKTEDVKEKIAVAATQKRERPRRDGWDNIAIVGMSCMFPKASDLAQYWQNILDKVDAIEEVPSEQWDWRNYYDEDPLARDRIYSKWGGFLKTITFDPTKYGIPPSSLTSIDPMQLMLLEITERALEDAGYKSRSFGRKKTSVILANAGHGPVTALMSLRSMLGWKLAHLDDKAKNQIADALPEWTEDSFAGYLGNVAAGRVANRFDLGGVNFSIDAACASSLAALYTSVQELRAGTSDVVFLAACDTHNQPGDYLSFSKTHAFSKQGRCRTFDATADGIVISEGVAMLVLKRQEDAERDGDRIYAVIKGVGGSSDGRDLSLTAPRPEGQMLAVKRAYEDAGINPSSVELVEAHGTGTVAGDKAEIEALKNVFEQSGAEKRSCAVGSVKTMIGHTKAAAGLASMIKIAKALHHKVLPPTIGVTVPNPSCDFENSPFYINSEVRPWIHADNEAGEEKHQRRAGVSAFGFGGTNFHCVLEEYEPACALKEEPCKPHWPAELFMLSAPARMDMVKSVQQLLEQVKRAQADADANLPSGFTRFAYKEFSKAQMKASAKAAANACRLTVVAEGYDDLVEKLKRAQSDLLSPQKLEFKDPRGIFFKEKTEADTTGKIAFLFPGQGSQQTNMLRDLSIAFPAVRKAFEEADKALQGVLPRSLASYIFPPPAFDKESQEKYLQELTDTRIAQPAVGAAGIAAFQLLSQLGIKADCTAGHSYGEYVALCAAGAMSVKDLIRISELRGRLLTAKVENNGTMAAVTAERHEVEKLLSTMAGITLANINAPNQCVISGDKDAVIDAVSAFKNQKIAARTISVSQAFHSQYMEHAKEPLKQALQAIAMSAPRIPAYSNTDAGTYSNSTDEIVNRLAEHIVKPVDFVSQIKRMQADGAYYFIEVGPGSVLTNLTSSILQDTPHLAVAIDRSGKNGITQLLNALAQLWSHGVEFDARGLYEGRIEQIPAPAESSTTGANGKPKLLYLIDSANINKATMVNGVLTAAPATQPKAPGAPAPSAALRPQSQTTSQPANLAVKQITPGPKAGTNIGAPSLMQAAQNVAQPQIERTNPAKESANRMTASTSNQAPRAPQATPASQPPQGSAYPQPQGNTYPLPQGMPRQAAGGNVDQVMIQFQQTMLEMTNSFLRTQQQVMGAYLQAKTGTMPQGVVQPQGFMPQQQMQQFVQPQFVQPQFVQPQFAQPQLPQYQEYAQPAMQTQYAQSAPAQPEFIAGNGHDAHNQIELKSIAPVIDAAAADTPAETNGHGAHADSAKAVQAVSAAPAEAISNEKLVEELLEIVSQRTGYPPEMLDPELDLEADLGIDSIKRVEILNSFRKILPESKQLELEGGLEQLAGTKTLKGIIDWINSEPSAIAAESNGSAPESNGKASIDNIDTTELNLNGTNGSNGSNGTNGSGSHGLSGNGNGNGHADIVQVAAGAMINGENGHGSNGNGANGNGANGNGHGTLEKTAVAAAAPLQTGFSTRKESASGHNIKRATVEVSQLNLPIMQPTKVPQGSIDLIIADEGDAWQEVGKSLTARGEKCVVIRHVPDTKDGLKINNGACELDATSLEAVQSVLQTVRKSHGKVARIIDLQPLNKADSTITGNAPPASLVTLLNFAKAAYADLNDPAHKGIATVTSASKLGGTFGSGSNSEAVAGLNRVYGAGISGFMKCLAKEWPGVRVKAIDFEPTLVPSQIASLVMTEMDAQEELEENEGAEGGSSAVVQKRVEIGYLNNGTTRVGLNVVISNIDDKTDSQVQPEDQRAAAISIDSSSVIVITGGARGITAEIALDLAMQFQPKLILLGRTPEPAAEAGYTAGLSSMRDIKGAIMGHLKDSGQQVSISLVEQQYQKLLRDREIRDNLAAMRAAGSQVEYLPVDVRDEAALEETIELITAEHGKIDGIIHGAGVIEDAFVKEKSQASFERVFTTKISSARVLSKLATNPALKFMFFFSSVVGRTGNAGQCDYVSANEVLNKLAVTLNRSSSARVASLMWGPWNAGMAQPELESLFARYGWAMIAPAAGRKAFIDDLLYGRKDEAELIIVAQLPAPKSTGTDKTVRLQDAFTRQVDDGTVEFESVLSPDVDLYLRDHTFDSVPVMPMAMALEMMAEAAQALCPDMKMLTVNRLEIPAGIVFDSASKTITVSARKVERAGQPALVETTVLTGNKRQHFKTSFELIPRTKDAAQNGNAYGPRISGLASIPSFVPTTATVPNIAKGITPITPLPTRQIVYRDFMFHGPLFQGITSVTALGEEGIVGELQASKPQACLSRSTGNNEWTIDPILLDSAMQLAGIWARQFLDITVLPTGFKNLHLGDRDLMLQDSYFARVFITPGTTARELTCDVAVYTKAGALAFVIEGLGGIGSKSLNRLSSQSSTSTGGSRS